MKTKNRFLLIFLTSLFCISNEQVYAVKLSTLGKVVGACTALSVATLIGLDIAFELQDVSTVYHPTSRFQQQNNLIPEIIESLNCNNDIQYFSDQVKAGQVDPAVITVNPAWFGYKGFIFDRRQARVQKLFAKAKELAPCVIVVEKNELTPIILPQLRKAQATRTFMREMRALEESSALILVDELLIDVMTEQLHEKKHEFTKNVLTKNVTQDEKLQYLEAKFQQMKTSTDIDIPLMMSLIQKEYTWGDLIKFVSLTQDFALQDNADAINFKHIYKANRADESYLTNLEQQIYVALHGGKKRSAYHESAHAMLGMHLDTGASVLGMSILPYQGSGGHVSYSGYATNQTDVQQQNCMMMCLAGGVSEQEFGIPEKKVFDTVDDGFNDFVVRPGVSVDLIYAYRMALNIIGDKQFEDAQTRQQYLNSVVKDAYGKTVEYIHDHRSDVQRLAEAVLQEEILSANEIRKLVGSSAYSNK